MARDTVHTPEDLEPFDLLAAPVWVVDFDRGAQWWCNLACLPVFRAASKEELLARSAATTPSPTSRTRLDVLRRRFERGERSLDRWTIYPSDGGPPLALECNSTGIHIAARRGEPAALAMLIEGRVLGADDVDPQDRRGVEALRYLGELVSVYGPDGAALMRNPAAVRVLGDIGDGDRFAASFSDPADAAAARASVAAGQPYRADTRVHTPDGDRWFDTEVRPSLDPIRGEVGLLVTQRDVSERRAQLAEIQQGRELLAAQAATLRALAAPVIQVGPGLLALPVIGALDPARLDALLAALHARLARGPVTHVVLDLTGAADVDADALAGLLRVVRVMQLQGVRTALSGIRPALARALVLAGHDLARVPCFHNLEDALHTDRPAP